MEDFNPQRTQVKDLRPWFEHNLFIEVKCKEDATQTVWGVTTCDPLSTFKLPDLASDVGLGRSVL